MSQTENKRPQEFTTINLYLGYKENPLEFDNFVAKIYQFELLVAC